MLGRLESPKKSQISPERPSNSPKKELKGGIIFFIRIMSLVVLCFKVKFAVTMSATFFDRRKKKYFREKHMKQRSKNAES